MNLVDELISKAGYQLSELCGLDTAVRCKKSFWEITVVGPLRSR